MCLTLGCCLTHTRFLAAHKTPLCFLMPSLYLSFKPCLCHLVPILCAAMPFAAILLCGGTLYWASVLWHPAATENGRVRIDAFDAGANMVTHR